MSAADAVREMPATGESDVAGDLAGLERLDAEALRTLWRRHLRGSPRVDELRDALTAFLSQSQVDESLHKLGDYTLLPDPTRECE